MKAIGNNPSLPFPSFGTFPAILGVPWPMTASFCSLLLSLHGHFICVYICLFSPLLIRTPVIGPKDNFNPL